MKFFIKNIADIGCLASVRNELGRLGLHTVSIDINEINTDEKLTPSQYNILLSVLQQAGIELFESKKDILVQKVKNLIMELIYHSEEPLVHNLSIYLSEKVQLDYTYISNLFSETQHTTIEKFYICHKIERVKELLLYEGMTLTEIAYKMHYSSLAHLSSQFKKVTGLTPSQFKQQFDKGDLPPENC